MFCSGTAEIDVKCFTYLLSERSAKQFGETLELNGIKHSVFENVYSLSFFISLFFWGSFFFRPFFVVFVVVFFPW